MSNIGKMFKMVDGESNMADRKRHLLLPFDIITRLQSFHGDESDDDDYENDFYSPLFESTYKSKMCNEGQELIFPSRRSYRSIMNKVLRKSNPEGKYTHYI